MEHSNIPENRMYGDLAYLWPLISPHTDYAEEAVDWIQAIRSHLGQGRHHILDLGTGGGHLLHYIIDEFDADAVDISQSMLDQAARLNPAVTHHCGDMRTIRLERTYDAVIIHDAISYMLTEDDLSQAFATARTHLQSGGIILLAPDYFTETFQSPTVDHSTKSDGKTELTLVEYEHDPDPSDTTIESIMTYYIKSEKELRIELDRHITGLFSLSVWTTLLENEGFSVEQWPCTHGDAAGRELLVGTLR